MAKNRKKGSAPEKGEVAKPEQKIGYKTPPLHTRFSSTNQPDNAGRPAGSLNFKTEAKKLLKGMSAQMGGKLSPMGILARQLISLCLAEKVNGKRVSPAVKLNALREILDRMEGKVAQTVDLKDDRPINVNLAWITTNPENFADAESEPEADGGNLLPGG